MLTNLNDLTLLIDISNLVKTEKQTTLRVLEYLSEIDNRRLYLKEGYSSLCDFCIRYLNYSEGEALRRIQACRAAREVEEVKDLLRNNELSLTGLSLIAPHITKQNAPSLLPEVKMKSKREIEKILDSRFPEARQKKELLPIVLDAELKDLIEQAKKKASEKDLTIVLKRVLKDFLREKPVRQSETKKHTRYVPLSLKRKALEQSGHQCSFRSQSGVRCNQIAHLEIDHVRPWAMGGSSHDMENLRVLCKAHNLMFAKVHFPARVSLKA